MQTQDTLCVKNESLLVQEITALGLPSCQVQTRDTSYVKNESLVAAMCCNKRNVLKHLIVSQAVVGVANVHVDAVVL